MATCDEIERLARRRQAIWASEMPHNGPEADRITARLADLYEIKRHEVAQFRAGTRTDIVRQARVESELERLMSEKARA